MDERYERRLRRLRDEAVDKAYELYDRAVREAQERFDKAKATAEATLDAEVDATWEAWQVRRK